jgi:hypothetical protein
MVVPVSYLGKEDLWSSYLFLKNRHWNAFGEGKIFDLSLSKAPAPALEINPPRVRIDRGIGGAFATDDRGRIYLIHRGKVGGGTPGVGKTNFLNWYTGLLEGPNGEVNLNGGSLLTVADGDRSTPVIVVGQLDGPRFIDSLATLVRCSAEFRALMKAGELRATKVGSENDRDLGTEETTNRRGYKVNRLVQANCDHALVVNSLLASLRSDGFDARRTRMIDIYIRGKDGGMTHLFEVKAACDTGSLYAALGQLEWHGRNMAKRLIAVLPVETSTSHRNRFSSLGIRVVTYAWKGNVPACQGLAKALV